MADYPQYPLFLRDDGRLTVLMPEYDPEDVFQVAHEFDGETNRLQIVFKYFDGHMERFPTPLGEHFDEIKDRTESLVVVNPEDIQWQKQKTKTTK